MSSKKNIKEVRATLGLTQQKMAELMGMARTRVTEIETGNSGRSETKGHIAHLIALDLIFEHGLLDELVSKLKE